MPDTTAAVIGAPTHTHTGDTVDTEPTLAQQLATGLRTLADLTENHPEFAKTLKYTFAGMNVFMFDGDPKAQMAAFIRAGLKHGAQVAKDGSDDWMTAKLMFGVVSLAVNARRDEVCERVVVGTETVTTTVPDPEALAAVPQVEVTETVERVEWICRPLLAADQAASAVAS